MPLYIACGDTTGAWPTGDYSPSLRSPWLAALEVGEERARAAIARIPGRRRPYPLNIARVLGVELPPPEQLPRLIEEAEDRMALVEAMARRFSE